VHDVCYAALDGALHDIVIGTAKDDFAFAGFDFAVL
jgi:hypothetical protein